MIAAETSDVPVAIERRTYFHNDMGDEIVWTPEGHEEWPPE